MKKLSAIIICLLMFLTCTLTGCAGFSVDRVKYYNEVVATVGNTKITRTELINAYNNTNNYYTQIGLSGGRTMDEVLDDLINLEAEYQYALNFKPDVGENPYKPTEYQINQIVQTIFDQLDGSMETLIKDAKIVLNIEIKKAEDEEETDATVYPRADFNYKKRAELKKTTIDGETKYFIQYITEDEPNKGEYKELIAEKFLADYTLKEPNASGAKDIVEEIRNKYLAHLQEDLEKDEKENSSAIYAEVLKTLSRNLISREYYLRDENGKPYNKDLNDLLYRYFESLFESQIRTQYQTNLKNYYLEHENLSINALIETYKDLYIKYRNKYDPGFEASYKADMKSNSTNSTTIEQTVYHPNLDQDTQFGYFIHTLFKFSDQQKTDIQNLANNYAGKTFVDYAKEYKENIENPKIDDATKQNLTKEYNEYKAAYTNLVLNTKVIERNIHDGTETDESNTKTLREVLRSSEYKNLVASQNIYDFVDFMFAYTQDDATLTATAPYIVGSYDESKGETFSTNSSMEEAFTNEAMKLMKAGNSYTMSDIYSATNPNAFDVENFCITSYGVHILYYISPLYENDIGNAAKVYIQTDNKADDLDGAFNLYTNYMNPLSEVIGKTYFDMLFDLVYPADSDGYTSNTNYSTYEKSLIELAKNEYEVVKYTQRIKATKASI